MPDNEKLIEEAAAERYPHRDVFLEGMAYMSEERSRLPLREAFVEGAKWQAEKAHTPTDDERELAQRLVARQLPKRIDPRTAEFVVRSLEEAGMLRRTEVPEPNAETEDQMHARGATTWDCDRCGQDPEDCACGDEVDPHECKACGEHVDECRCAREAVEAPRQEGAEPGSPTEPFVDARPAADAIGRPPHVTRYPGRKDDV